ncbi:MAG: PEP/pyruvate-binding domain-containing protein [Bacteroidota bacterium]
MASAIWIKDLKDDLPAGGKALGLAKLQQLGFQVPQTLVLLADDSEDDWQNTVFEAFTGKKVAVRSSAEAEDGQDQSFAGQFESYLNVSGKENILEAINKCLESAKASRVKAYSGTDAHRMNVIVQEMVNAKYAGVLFTADPVNQRTDRAILNAVKGLGEALVSGEADGQSYLHYKNGQLDLPEGAFLKEAQCTELFETARKIAKAWKMEVDLEWAIDQEGNIQWLQCRPITTLPIVNLNELDTPKEPGNDVITRGNIGEMMPGPVTPLTWSVFGYAIEQGMQHMYIQGGARKKQSPEFRYTNLYFSHMFLNITKMYDVTKAVLLARPENVEFSVMGETLENSDPGKKLAWPIRARNLIKQAKYYNSAPKRLEELIKLEKYHDIPEGDDPISLFDSISEARQNLCTAYGIHFCTSGQSGALNSVILNVLSKGQVKPSQENYRDVARLLVDIDQVESAEVLRSMEKLVHVFRQDEELADILLKKGPAAAFETMSNKQSPGRDMFRAFLSIHGHRCVKEAELREKNWAQEPSILLEMIRTQLRAPVQAKKVNEPTFEKHKEEIFSRLKRRQKAVIKRILDKARDSVARREISKSACIRLQYKIKLGYLKLAQQLVTMNLLDDEDQIFFLQHDEIGQLVHDLHPTWKNLAAQRRELHPVFESLTFEDINYGYPSPIEVEKQIEEGSLVGIPVSIGKTSGKIRIIRKLEDAHEIQPGEILVAQITDVGWSPYFSLISGLITEIGSPLSHGAVVAREYGLPAVVGVKGALKALKTGQLVELDGINGTVSVLD